MVETRCATTKSRRALGIILETLIYPVLGLRIDAGRRVVQHDNAALKEERTRERGALPLTAGEAGAAFANAVLVTIWKLHDEVMGLGGLSRGDDLFHARIGATVGNVVRHGVRKQHWLLQRDADLLSQRILGDIPHIVAVDLDRA